jgi:uncharacterized membrane protein
MAVLGVISWAVTGSYAMTGSIVVLHTAVQIPAYYVHDVVWLKLKRKMSDSRQN